MKKRYFKFLRTGMVSDYDGSRWYKNKWRSEPEEVREPCKGLNCSEFIQDALYYIQGEILVEAEIGGNYIKSSDKLTCQRMRYIKSWRWTKQLSVRLALFSVLVALKAAHIKESQKAIKGVLAKKRIDYAAANAVADAVACAADAAANATRAAYAARAAARAAYAARAAADAAADAAAKKTIHNYILHYIEGDKK
jgi:hypothetical protein